MTDDEAVSSAEPITEPTLEDVLAEMAADYRTDPIKAVRSQSFIKLLHRHLADDLRSRLTDTAKSDGVEVKEEAMLFGSHKPKDADVAVIHPDNGVLLSIGVRSQMGSVGKNVLEYYQGIIGECISLQDRFPMAVYGYAYLHPVLSKKSTKRTIDGEKATVIVDEHPDTGNSRQPGRSRVRQWQRNRRTGPTTTTAHRPKPAGHPQREFRERIGRVSRPTPGGRGGT